MKKWLTAAVFITTSWWILAATPDSESAKQLVAQQSTAILEDLKNNAAKYQANSTAFEQFIDTRISPYLDYDKMAEIALGRHLREVRNNGKFDAFKTAFHDLILRAYSKGWSNYTQATVRILGASPVDQYNRTTVRLQVTGNDKKTANMLFALWYTDGQWKIYDATFENVSLMTSYRNTFDSDLEREGVDGLIKKIQQIR